MLKNPGGGQYLAPFLLVTSLFFLWGFAHSLLDVLNKHFQVILGVSKAQSGLIQAAVYGGYFVMAIPAGIFMKKFGYKKGILLGLILYATGALCFLPATYIREFWAFLAALFIIALGLASLETAANPYITVMGPPERGTQRLNLAQSFNGLGWVIGPIAGSLILFASTSGADKFQSLAIPYVGIAIVVLLVALLFHISKLPDIDEAALQHSEDTRLEESHAGEAYRSLLHYPHFIFAVVAQFFYVAAQTGINSFFINYVTEIFQLMDKGQVSGEATMQGLLGWVGRLDPGLAGQESLYNTTAGFMLSFGFGIFMLGRFTGSLLLTWFRPGRLLAVYALASLALTVVVINGAGLPAIIALVMIYFFMSIMFPTIFALGLKGMGSHTRRASSFIIMAIVGGAVFTPLMGYVADIYSMHAGFWIPFVCFFVVLMFAIKGHKLGVRLRI
jgi:FHS family L-fucose permease-like MFS transporter